jgi:hypothetical protein
MKFRPKLCLIVSTLTLYGSLFLAEADSRGLFKYDREHDIQKRTTNSQSRAADSVLLRPNNNLLPEDPDKHNYLTSSNSGFYTSSNNNTNRFGQSYD